MVHPAWRLCLACLETTPCLPGDHALPAWRLRLACLETTPCLHAIKAKLYASQNPSYNILTINR